MRLSRLQRACLAACLLGPLIAVTSAHADTTPVGRTSSPTYQDVQLPPEVPTGDLAPHDDPSGEQLGGPASPPPFSDAENRLVADYLAKKLTAKQFTALGVSAAVGGPLPAQYQNGNTEGGDHSSHGDGSDEHGDSTSTSTTGHQGLAQAGPESVGAGAGSSPVAAAADPSVFLQYVFAVAATESQADQAEFASVFQPLSAADSNPGGSAPVPALGAHALTAAAAAAPPNPQCATPTAISLSPLRSTLRQFLPVPVLNLKLPAALVFGCMAVTAHFRVYYSLKSTDASNGIPDKTTSASGIPDYLSHVTGSLEEAYNLYAGQGYLQPKGQVTVLLTGLWGAMGDGAGVTPPPVGGRQTIIMDNQDGEFYLPRHELFHAFQYRYIAVLKYAISLTGFENMNWWMEATAEWAAHQSLAASSMSLIDASGTNEATGYDERLPAFLGTPQQRLDKWSVFGGQGREYGAFILAEYLSGRFGIAAVLHSWQHIGKENGFLGLGLGGTYPVHAIKETVAGYGSSMQAEMPMFAKAIYQLGPDANVGTTVCVPDYGGSPLDGTGGCSSGQYPVSVGGSGFGSNQFQFNNPDVTDWIHQLSRNARTSNPPPGDPAPADLRPEHAVILLNYLGFPNGIDGLDRPFPVNTRLSPGGMSFNDLTWNNPTGALQVTVSAPKHTQLHASLISWTSYRTRCAPDQDVNVPAGGQVSLTAQSLVGCAFSTLILTDTNPNDAQDSSSHVYQWISEYTSVVPV